MKYIFLCMVLCVASLNAAQYVYEIELRNEKNKTVYYDIHRPHNSRWPVLKSKLSVFKGSLKPGQAKTIQTKQEHRHLYLYDEGWFEETRITITPDMIKVFWTDNRVMNVKKIDSTKNGDEAKSQ